MAKVSVPWWRKALEFALGGLRAGLGLLRGRKTDAIEETRDAPEPEIESEIAETAEEQLTEEIQKNESTSFREPDQAQPVRQAIEPQAPKVPDGRGEPQEMAEAPSTVVAVAEILQAEAQSAESLSDPVTDEPVAVPAPESTVKLEPELLEIAFEVPPVIAEMAETEIPQAEVQTAQPESGPGAVWEETLPEDEAVPHEVVSEPPAGSGVEAGERFRPPQDEFSVKEQECAGKDVEQELPPPVKEVDIKREMEPEKIETELETSHEPGARHEISRAEATPPVELPIEALEETGAISGTPTAAQEAAETEGRPESTVETVVAADEAFERQVEASIAVDSAPAQVVKDAEVAAGFEDEIAPLVAGSDASEVAAESELTSEPSPQKEVVAPEPSANEVAHAEEKPEAAGTAEAENMAEGIPTAEAEEREGFANPPAGDPAKAASEKRTAARLAAQKKRIEEADEQSPFSVIVAQVYEGPLDLLLDLIRKQDIDIYDIPIAKITAQFLAYVDRLRASDVDVAGEFIYVASLLIHIKSRTLLPRAPAGPEDAAEDPRRELVERLLEHERFKSAAQMLQQKQLLEAASWTNPGFAEFRDDVEAEPEIAADTVDLVRVFREILDRARKRPVIDLKEDSITVGQMIQFVARRLTMDDKPVALRRLLSYSHSERALIAMFLALLELVRLQAILLRQDRQFSEIFIKKQDGFDAAMNEGLLQVGDDWR